MNDLPPAGPPISPIVESFLTGPPKKLLIGNAWVNAQSGRTFQTYNPATEELLGNAAAGDADDVDAAVRAARQAFEQPSWRRMPPHERSLLLSKIADEIETNTAELAQLETLDNGCPIAFTTGMVADVVKTFRYYAGWPTKIYGETNPSAGNILNYTLREPIGVCGQIVPWNGPLGSAAWKIAPAIASGNTVVLKPAEQTPLTAIRLGEILLEAGLPPGVVNIVTGFGETAGAALVAHPGVNKIAFTGSTEVGKHIMRSAAGTMKRVTLELGGKSPNIIFPDADLDKAAAVSAAGFCFLSGQACIASSRIFVHERVYDEFIEKLLKSSGYYIPGNPLEIATTMGPLVSQEQFQRVTSYYDTATKDGAALKTGGQHLGRTGHFVSPTVYANVTNDMRIAQEEIFGPVTSVIKFADEASVVAQANETEFGLAAAVWTKDINRAHRVSAALLAGTVWINTYMHLDQISPFGGYKQSGFGRELGRHSIDAYTEVKSIFADLN